VSTSQLPEQPQGQYLDGGVISLNPRKHPGHPATAVSSSRRAVQIHVPGFSINLNGFGCEKIFIYF